MTSPSRAPRTAPAALLLAVGLAVAGCGGSTGSGTPAAAASRPSAPATSSSSDATSAASPTPSDPTSAAASPTASSPRVQLISIDKFGISYELPKSWITLNAKNVLKDGARNPFLKQLADRLGASPDQLVRAFSTAVQSMSVSDSGAVHGFVDNVNTVGQEGDLNDDQVKLQLATLGAKPGTITHTSTDVGDVSRVPYTIEAKVGLTIHAVAVAVRTSTSTVVITVSSSTAARAAAIADRIQASLARLPGGGSGL